MGVGASVHSPHSLGPEKITASDLQADHFSEDTIAADTDQRPTFHSFAGVDESSA